MWLPLLAPLLQAAPAAEPRLVGAGIPLGLHLHLAHAGAARPRQHCGQPCLVALPLPCGQLPGRAGARPRRPAAAQSRHAGGEQGR